MTYSSASRCARVRIERRSLPVFGSLIAMTAISSPRAMGEHVVGDDLRMMGKSHRGAIRTGEFLDQNRGVAVVASRAAVFLRHSDAQQTLGACSAPQSRGNDAVVLPLLQMRHDLAIDEAPYLVAKEIVIVAKHRTHGFDLSACRRALVEKGAHGFVMFFGVMGKGLKSGRKLEQRIESDVLALPH